MNFVGFQKQSAIKVCIVIELMFEQILTNFCD